MSTLADEWGGGFLPEGRHICRITDFRVFRYNSGNCGVEFALENRDGDGGRIAFCLEKSIRWRLAKFARHCGLTRDDCRAVDCDARTGFQIFKGRVVGVVAVLGDPDQNGNRYIECVETFKPPTSEPQPAQADQPHPSDSTASNCELPTGNGIPF